ncbi:hypothetical protein ACHAPQ_009019 [Fusarium lateritium]
MDQIVQKSMQSARTLRKSFSSVTWRADQPWKQPFYKWSHDLNEWQSLQTSGPSSLKRKVNKLAIYSWNIDFMLPHGDVRMNAALAHLEELTRQHRSDDNTALVINLQECVPSDLVNIGRKPWIRDGFYCTDIDTSSWGSGLYGTTTLVDRRLEVSSCFRVHYSASKMERDALFVDISLESDKRIRLCNTHLESLALEPPLRPAQMGIIATHMRDGDVSGAVVTGDFNAIQPFDRTLHTDNALKDAYLTLGGEEDDEGGYTWGQQALPGLRRLYGCSRMDKVFFCGDSLRVSELERFGDDVEPDHGEEDARKELLSFGFEKPWITDHLAVKAVFDIID